MAYLLSNVCTKNYWNQTTIVEIIDGGWVVSFFETQCITTLQKFTGCRLSATKPPNLRPSQTTWAVSPPVDGYTVYAYCYYSSRFTAPRRVWGHGPTHCSKDVLKDE